MDLPGKVIHTARAIQDLSPLDLPRAGVIWSPSSQLSGLTILELHCLPCGPKPAGVFTTVFVPIVPFTRNAYLLVLVSGSIHPQGSWNIPGLMAVPHYPFMISFHDFVLFSP